MIEYPLSNANRIRLAQAFRFVPRVDYSIDCAIEGQMGIAYVDNLEIPTAYRIDQGSFVYLAGNPRSPGGISLIDKLEPFTILFPSADGWLALVQEIYPSRLGLLDRYSFSGKDLNKMRQEELFSKSPFYKAIRRIDAQTATDLLEAKIEFFDIAAYDSAQDFFNRGIGYCYFEAGSPQAAAYASLVCSQGIEISLFVEREWRGKGIATALSAALILWCLQNQMTPHWDAANPESCKLALKLGYQPLGSYQAHYITNF